MSVDVGGGHVNMLFTSCWNESMPHGTPVHPVATLLTLDISGAFDNAAHTRLTHNLQKRQVPQNIVNWIANFLRHRTTDHIVGRCDGPVC